MIKTENCDMSNNTELSSDRSDANAFNISEWKYLTIMRYDQKEFINFDLKTPLNSIIDSKIIFPLYVNFYIYKIFLHKKKNIFINYNRIIVNNILSNKYIINLFGLYNNDINFNFFNKKIFTLLLNNNKSSYCSKNYDFIFNVIYYLPPHYLYYLIKNDIKYINNIILKKKYYKCSYLVKSLYNKFEALNKLMFRQRSNYSNDSFQNFVDNISDDDSVEYYNNVFKETNKLYYFNINSLKFEEINNSLFISLNVIKGKNFDNFVSKVTSTNQKKFSYVKSKFKDSDSEEMNSNCDNLGQSSFDRQRTAESKESCYTGCLSGGDSSLLLMIYNLLYLDTSNYHTSNNIRLNKKFNKQEFDFQTTFLSSLNQDTLMYLSLLKIIKEILLYNATYRDIFISILMLFDYGTEIAINSFKKYNITFSTEIILVLNYITPYIIDLLIINSKIYIKDQNSEEFKLMIREESEGLIKTVIKCLNHKSTSEIHYIKSVYNKYLYKVFSG